MNRFLKCLTAQPPSNINQADWGQASSPPDCLHGVYNLLLEDRTHVPIVKSKIRQHSLFHKFFWCAALGLHESYHRNTAQTITYLGKQNGEKEAQDTWGESITGTRANLRKLREASWNWKQRLVMSPRKGRVRGEMRFQCASQRNLCCKGWMMGEQTFGGLHSV